MKRILAVASGCLMVGLSASPSGQTQATPTFYKEVLPILQNNCQTCHRPGEVAPMSLISYEDARPWARAIKTKTTAKQMPPWFADPDYGLFANERKLTAREIDTLAAWADAGAPAGNAKDAPAPKHFESGWNIKPDVIVEMPKAFELPATGTINYKYIVVNTNFKEDMWVVAAEMRPGNPKVLHHGKVWVRPAGSTWMKDAVPGEAYENETQRDVIGKNSPEEGNDILGKFNPGLGAQRFDQEGAAKFVPKGSDLVYEMHYTATGKPESDVSKLGLVLASADPKKRYYFHAGPTAQNLAIPPADGNAEVVSEVTLDAPGRLVYAQPHMHLRGKDFEMRAVFPGGESKTLLKGRFDFEWQMGYQYAEPVALPKGTKLRFVTHFDNSPANRFNPDPTKKIVWGPQNWDEMSNCFIGVLFDRDVNVAKAFLRSGVSVLPRGESGPTLAVADNLKSGTAVPAFNASGDTFEKQGGDR
jgi:hypothetical protein